LKSLGSYSGERIIRAFQKAGWRMARQKGSHVILQKEDAEAILSIPIHAGKNVKRGTLRGLIRDAGLTVDEFLELV
jgi:predicted RNA binding protein YcfA (HicA-like mRNA interferase family)